ncbi:hypothetical protein ACQ86O_10715 [Serratia sp. L9]|uniref:hypothetical protein n=1 Tax=Serratia sp. L9 TaxID=3423946 RepID=UPI003D670264
MTLCSPRITRVALLTPCQLMEQGFERLLEEMADIRLSWCMESVTEASLRLITSPVEMLIVVISAHQAECQRHLQLIRALRRTRPGMKIVVILDVYIPYFLQLLAEQNVDGILSQHEPLEQLRDAISQVAEGGFTAVPGLRGLCLRS